MRKELTAILENSVQNLIQSGALPEQSYDAIEISEAKSAQHGDFACNFALITAKKIGKNPREIAEKFKEDLETQEIIEKVEIAGPGFINLFLKKEYILGFIAKIIDEGNQFAHTQLDKPEKINVEFVSVNPTGPITVGSGRGAAYGETLCRVLEACGHDIHREYYVNDGVNSEQMRLFGASTKHFVMDKLGFESTFPDGGYKGSYVFDVAMQILEEHGPECAKNETTWFQIKSQDLMYAKHKSALKKFGVEFDTWYSEQSLTESGAVEKELEELKKRGATYEKEGALWLESTKYGDDKDRVLIREDKRPTYVTSDIAYHKTKYERGATRLIDIMGQDHHGYKGRIKAAMEALGYDPDTFDMIIYQIVRLLKDGKPTRMRKRDGNIYELEDLVDETGVDTARFFYLMRSHDTLMDFDIDLATKETDDNPVFYVQYAHARICSIIDKAKEEGLTPDKSKLDLIQDKRELALIKKVLSLPHEIQRCSEDYGIHRLTTFAIELARAFHHFYDGCRVIDKENEDLSKARLAVCQVAQFGLQASFNLLGISAPKRMSRKEAAVQ